MLWATASGSIKRTYPHRAAFNTSQITVSCWMRPNVGTAFNNGVVRRDNAATTDGNWALGIGGTANRMRFTARIGGASKTATDNADLTLFQMYHIVGRYDQVNVEFFRDGVSRAQTASTAALPSLTQDISLFEVSDSSTPHGDWYLAELGIWNVALTQDEITSLSIGASPRLIRPASLVLYDPLFVNSTDRIGQAKTDTGTLQDVQPSPRIIQPDHHKWGRKSTATPALTKEIIAQYLLDVQEVYPGITVRQALRLILSHHVGRSSGHPSAPIYRDPNNLKNVISEILDGNGNRTSVTFDAT